MVALGLARSILTNKDIYMSIHIVHAIYIIYIYTITSVHVQVSTYLEVVCDVRWEVKHEFHLHGIIKKKNVKKTH